MLLHQVIHEEPPSPRKLNGTIPRDLETITLKCLEKDASRRYQTAQALADDLTHWLDGEPITARPVTWMERSWRWCKRKPAVAGLCAIISLLLLTLGVSGMIFGNREVSLRRQADDARVDKAKQRKLATDKAAEAERERQKAIDNFKTAERSVYSSDMLLAQRDWEDANIVQLRELLDRHRNHDHLKGFEWDYWNRRLKSDLLTLKGHSSTVTSVSFSPDGKRIVSGSFDNSLKVWDAQTGLETLTLKGHTRMVSSVSFSPDGTRIVSGSGDGAVKIWDGRPLEKSPQ